MDVVLLGQPDRSAGSVGASVGEALGWSDAKHAWFAVAWAKRSGLTRIQDELVAFRTGRRTTRALIGVDQHGATEEGLRLALQLFSQARIYHDRALDRTFHPKLYVVEARRRARLIIGSGNLTLGGLYENYELSLRVDLNLRDEADTRLLGSCREWFEKRWNATGATLKLSLSTITALLAEPEVDVGPETWGPPRRRGGARPMKPSGGSLFGPGVKGLARAPRPSRKASPLPRVDESDAVLTASSPAPEATRLDPDDTRVLAACLSRGDRWGQPAFNAQLAADFFGVRANGELISVEAVDRKGRIRESKRTPLVRPPSSGNHRFDWREPEGRPLPATGIPIVLVHELDVRQFRYLYVLPTDVGYKSIRREIERRPAVGVFRKPETKRVYLTRAAVRNAWPNCPLVALPLE